MTHNETIDHRGAGQSAARGSVKSCLFFLVTMIFAALPWWPIYGTPAFVVLVGVVTCVGFVIAFWGKRWGWAPLTMGVVVLGAYCVIGVPLAVPDQAVAFVFPSLQGFRDLIVGSVLSWKQLLTVSPPLGSYQALLVPALIVFLGCTVAGFSIVLRTRISEVAVAASVFIFLTGIALGPTSTFLPFVSGLGILLVSLLWVMGERRVRRRSALHHAAVNERIIVGGHGRRMRGLQPVAVIMMTLVVAAIGGVAATAVLPPVGEREVLRTQVEPPFDPRAYASPLVGFRGFFEDAVADEPMLTVRGLPVDGRLRLAALDTYNGIVYSVAHATGVDGVDSSQSFRRLPYRLDQSGIAGREVTLDITVEEYNGVWVPGVDALRSITFQGPTANTLRDQFFYNSVSGTGAVLASFAPGDRYRAETILSDVVNDDELHTLKPGNAPLNPERVVPEGIQETINSYTSYTHDNVNPGQNLARIIESLRLNGFVSHSVSSEEPLSRSGHSADRITQLLSDIPMLGDAEQYAVTAALMAQEIGFPARVVVGFLPRVENRDNDGLFQVTGRDMTAWIEVHDHHRGWVSIDPNPPLRDVPEKKPHEPTLVSRPQTAVQPPIDDTMDLRDQQPPQVEEHDPPQPVNPWLTIIVAIITILGWTLLVSAILLSPFIAVIAVKRRRRRIRRNAPDAVAKMVGAWSDFEDTAIDYGIIPARGATRREIADTVAEPRSLMLATEVDRSVFSPDNTTETDAQAIWGIVDDLRVLRATNHSWRERLRAIVSLRSLGRYPKNK